MATVEKKAVREDWVNPAEAHLGDFATVLWNALVGCDHDIKCAPGGGIKCIKCGGWFCY